MKHREIRQTFLDFYAQRDHKIIASSSLIPKDDPTMLFTSAGMVQFKPFFAGSVPLSYTRATTIQKCLRATDLERVGKSYKYCTFFEMLGNFSFGDYFKKEAIPWAWEYLTQAVKLPKDRLWVSVYEQDDEAYQIWLNDVGLESKRIFKLGEKDNFWGPAGSVGACGPCSEIYYDLGEELGCKKETCGPGCDCPRFIEVYNIVFPQYDKQLDGTMLPLKNRGIDTGMGMERLCMVSQEKKSIFETDLFVPIIKTLGKILNEPLNDKNRLAYYAAADHCRALTFAIGDGAIPSNDGRGYMLRSILRRALLFAYKIGIEEPYLYRLSGEIIAEMRQWYPEYREKQESIALIIKSEEERFLRTISAGLTRWEELADQHKDTKIIPGTEIFKLHDTFGLPVELTQELAQENNYTLDLEGYEKEMAQQKERSRKVVVDVKTAITDAMENALAKQSEDFVGYESDEIETNLLIAQKLPNNLWNILLENTPFYAEAGGQVGDTGKITGENFELEVVESYYKNKHRWSKAKLIKGELSEGVFIETSVSVKAFIDKERRREIERAHTATHLLHAALRSVVGEYVKQEGSLVEPGRFRFDFTCPIALSKEQIQKVEELIYSKIVEDLKVDHLKNIPIEEAKIMGALAFFGEAYEERVNVLRIGNFSRELCGGTHLRRTGEIGMFKITSETSIAAGIRRIEAVIGKLAFQEIKRERLLLDELNQKLEGKDNLLVSKIDDLFTIREQNQRQLEKLTSQIVETEVEKIMANIETVSAIRIVHKNFDYLDLAALRMVADKLREKISDNLCGFLVSSSIDEERVRYILFVSDNLKKQMPANELARSIGKALEGGGGGKPELAEGGGKKSNIQAAFEILKSIVNQSIADT
ncbi:MAG: alanine--tRNA ligase [Candidatus Latescibacteria bacterium]|nr:alanine--tRNA ligase [Candidatus Latescibacterota bacterium]